MRYKIEFELSGNETAVHAVVRRALDHVGFVNLPFFMTEVSESAADRITQAINEFIALNPAPTPIEKPRPEPVSCLVSVDLYVCEHDKLSVEVERVPSADDYGPKALMQMEWGDPACPMCEREMIHVGRKLRKTR